MCLVYLFENLKLPPTIPHFPLANIHDYQIIMCQLKIEKAGLGMWFRW